jgi:hypothetical protein
MVSSPYIPFWYRHPPLTKLTRRQRAVLSISIVILSDKKSSPNSRFLTKYIIFNKNITFYNIHPILPYEKNLKISLFSQQTGASRKTGQPAFPISSVRLFMHTPYDMNEHCP